MMSKCVTCFSNRIQKKSRGFSFLEIMLVVVIIGIMASLITPMIVARLNRAKIVRAKDDIKSLATGLGTYQLEVGDYPTTEQGLEALVTKPSEVSKENWSQVLQEIPQDPWGQTYIYKCPGEHGEFDLICKGKDKKEGTEDDINNFPRARSGN